MVINSPSSILNHPSSPSRSSVHHSSPPKPLATATDLPIRTACNFCRSKKIKCDKTAIEDGGCARCKREEIMCCYDVRDPIGRPKKRRMTGDASPVQSSSSTIHQSPQQARITPKGLTSNTISFNPERSYAEAGMYQPQSNGSLSSLTNKFSPINASYSSAIASSSQWPNLPPLNAVPPKYNNIYNVGKPQNAQLRNNYAAQPTSQSLSPSNQSVATSSHGMTPSSSTTTFETIRPSSIDDAPNLSDLGLAAFLESLDTLEINTEDGLTAAMLEALAASSLKEDVTHAQIHQQSFLPSLSSSVNSIQNTANLQGSTSYAVPADLSWADSSWLDQISAQSASSLDKMNKQKAAEPFTDERHEISSTSMNRKRDEQERSMQTVFEPEKSTSCCCGKDDANVTQATPQSHVQQRTLPSENSSTRVHCVPDPTGKGCTCLCDVSVALINVRATLRQTREDQCADNPLPIKDDNKRAASTLQLTLSASQAVAAQCACSASCPTCRTDPSTSLSASLLVSTALQIYIRAVRTLRQGFGAGDSRSNFTESIGGAENGGHIHATGSEWDVSIGQYKPKATNARRIALFAMKLELRDLRDAIAKVSRAASRTGSVTTNEKESSKIKSCCSDNLESNQNELAQFVQSSSVEAGINPVDQVVIRKLHQQLGDLLRTVEGIEEQQDAERNALSAGNDLMYS
ncbi:uncharacterized protein FA14DRAFT_14583 [Meira miltonrushii]|uniref:Zn(2)-C6 fungal-type domain-containing protein n=1 Tax=Meira miltonrushii TaxID=1280837 RepID=A0A316VIX6_9BASI|nr:uncharacterized protein FA14DRAFT_14583 [Meira miltonrushii]PWN37496.1 hypothetical protein FA14DRAFT_14583 [Meira miltonrushii]